MPVEQTRPPSEKKLSDVQAKRDFRQIAIDKVGVKDVTYPLTIRTRDGGEQSTIATVSMYVSLPHHQKGTHMSRFLEVLNDCCSDAIHPEQLMHVCHEIREKLDAEDAHLEVAFTYFMKKQAPVTGLPGLMDYQVNFECTADGVSDFIMGVTVPATSLCPCSKTISAYGAHNQRCEIEARVRMKGLVWIEDIVEIVEQSASAQLYAVLKRPDEKYVTEEAFDHPKFVEDIVRDLAVALDETRKVTWYEIHSTNFESIHNHNAYAQIVRDKRND